MNPRRSNSSLPMPGRSAYGAVTAAALLLIPVIVLVGGDNFREFLNFGAGVLSLVSLSCSVIWGLVASDRMFLNVRQRIVAQAVHRTTAIASVAFLVVHISVKLVLEHTTYLGALIPFSLAFTDEDAVMGTGVLIGFGSLAAMLMIITAVTGALRSVFASPALAARWRAFHMLAYPAWCFALVHGLYAGREAKPFFVILYSLCLVGVAAALALRSAPLRFKRQVADKILAVLGSETPSAREALDASRARVAEEALGGADRGRRADTPLPGFGSRGGADPFGDSTVPPQRTPSPTIYESIQRVDAPDTGPGFAAAYRAVSASPRAQEPEIPDLPQSAQFPADMQPTQTLPPVDGGSTTGTRWPAPSPPPVGEAPPSAYDPLYDTAAGVAYPGITETPYGTTETNSPYDTYNTNDTYDSGPATETLPGAFDSPGSGEPWNAPSGGFK
ncbi:cytochrome b/b6 domain-containing protein [Streptomyces sp. NPDC002845]